MKKVKHKFIRKERNSSNAIFNLNPSADGTVAFKITMNGKEYGHYEEYTKENFYSRMRTLVLIKNQLIYDLNKIKKEEE